jgi:hypothetical protein
MDTVRADAMRLRLSGKSYNEIRDALGVPKSTLSGWFKNVVLSDGALARLASRARLGSSVLIKRNKMQTQRAEQHARDIHIAARKKIPALTKRDLLIIGTVLYWAEGFKRLHIRDGKERMGHSISFVNADPAMIKVFLRFLYEILEVSKESVRVTMRLYPHINEGLARKYWMEATGLPESSFQKTTQMTSAASSGKRPFNRLPYGTLQVALYNTVKFHTLIGLIEGVQERL